MESVRKIYLLQDKFGLEKLASILNAIMLDHIPYVACHINNDYSISGSHQCAF